MTCRRAQKRKRSGAQRPRHEDGAPTAGAVTAEERAELDQLLEECGAPKGDALMLTTPGCDRPEHRAHIYALIQAAAGGHPSAAGGVYRMRCGCALLLHGQMRLEWS